MNTGLAQWRWSVRLHRLVPSLPDRNQNGRTHTGGSQAELSDYAGFGWPVLARGSAYARSRNLARSPAIRVSTLKAQTFS